MPLREITVDGCDWQVWEVHPGRSEFSLDVSMVAEGNREGWLCFRCSDSKRRLIPIPEGWENLPDNQLAELTRRAMVVAEGRRKD